MLALLVALLLVAPPGAAPLPPPQVLAALEADPCALGREIAARPPCLAAGECEALELWRRRFGPPRKELLHPDRSPDRTARVLPHPGRGAWPQRLGPLPAPGAYCLADPAAEGSDPRPTPTPRR